MKGTKTYESPAVRYCDFELSGFICQSGIKTQVDRWDSIDGGEVIFDDDTPVTLG